MGNNQRRRVNTSSVSNTSNQDSPEMNSRRKSSKMKKRKKKRRVVITTIIVIIALFSVGFFTLYSKLNKMKRNDINDKNLEISDKFNKNSVNYSDIFGEIENIALLGVDEEVDGIQRSDALMIGTLDNNHKKLKLTSLMRDTYVNIPGHGYDKLTHAYAYGGAELTLATINKNFDLNITDYVAVDFTQLEEIIDAIGGVTLDLDDEAIGYLNEYLEYVYGFYGQPMKAVKRSSDGLVHLNGFEALGYSRNRNTPDGDFGRTERQRNLMDAMFQKISSFGVAKLASTMTKLLPYVETSLTNTEILALGTQVLSLGNFNIEQQRFPRDEYSQNSMINEVFYFTFDEEPTREQIYEYIFNDKKIWETSTDSNIDTN